MGKESRRLVLTAASLFCLLGFVFLYAAFFSWSFSPFDSWNRHLWSWSRNTDDREPLDLLLRRLVRGEDRGKLQATRFSCYSELHSDVCVISKQVRIKNYTVFVPSDRSSDQLNRSVQPYPRKEDGTAMKAVNPVQIFHGVSDPPACHFTHEVPAVVFSTGGFTGNVFHEFNEVVIPLFITSQHFRSRLQFVITDYKPWMIDKYKKVLNQLSAYKDINAAEDGRVHCFPGAVIGLKYHDNLALNASDIPGGYTISDFRQFLRKSFGLKIKNVSATKHSKPVLLLISRRNTRRFLNEDEIVVLMKGLGFEVIVTPPSNMLSLEKFARVVNSCDVLVGVHGAGLTNSLWLPARAVVVQVVPLGLDWAATTYYGDPPKQMGLQYLEYKIEPEESSLLDSYSRDDPVIANPESILLEGYEVARAVYLDRQDVKINLLRFKEVLVQARKLLAGAVPPCHASRSGLMREQA